MKCDRCGQEFVQMDALPKQHLDVYVKRETEDINGAKIHKWFHAPLCPYCDKLIYHYFFENRNVEKL